MSNAYPTCQECGMEFIPTDADQHRCPEHPECPDCGSTMERDVEGTFFCIFCLKLDIILEAAPRARWKR